ncbi:hypothetical protein [Aureimonas sp. D3]|uniref:hypothetical protein n=1 Tax=Aureimonas sp. D3 TaxID=1638164 RepID=UPI000784D833|nr:hypothetical protein [Aureimonas sp. D3]
MLAIIFGAMRLHWLSCLIPLGISLGLSALSDQRSSAWRMEHGLEVVQLTTAGWLVVVAFDVVYVGVLYMLGRGIRHLWDKWRSSRAAKAN